jgi:mitochondrial fission protein ELM1
MPEDERARGARPEVGPESLVIWRFSDGKAGHDNQSLGLAEALAREVPCEIHSVMPIGAATALIGLASGQTPAYAPYPDPDLILGAGHATHLSMLTARRSRGGRIVVMMTPTLPKRLFDLCLIPEHDKPRAADNVVVTLGALNRVRWRPHKNASAGLILLGGPSPHFAFDRQKVLAQMRVVLEREPAVLWTATSSRRTPPELVESLRAMRAPNLELVPAEQTAPGWLSERLAQSARVWVTEDSVSMVYEALSSGAAVGLISLDLKTPGRVSRGIQRLINEQWVTRYDQWINSKALREPVAPLNEAKRCATLLLERWPDLTRH